MENNGGTEIKSKLFDALKEKNGKSSFILHILETINEKIVDNIYSSLRKLKTKKGFSFTSLIKQSSVVQEDEILQKGLIQFFEPLIQAKYYALALTLKQIVMKENEKEEENIYENLNSIKLNISEEEINKISLIENNFVLIENSLKDLSGDLFEKCNGMILQKLGYTKNEFVSQLLEEMSKIMWNLDFKLSGDTSDQFIPCYFDFRAVQISRNGGNGTLATRLIEKIFAYVTSPFDWIGKKAANSRNGVFQKVYGQLNSIVEFFRSFVLRKIPIENMFVQLYYHEKIRGKKLKGKILQIIGNFQKDMREEKTWKEIKKDFGELMKEIEILVKILNLKDAKPKDIEKMLKQTETKKESIQEEKKEEDDFSLDSDSFTEEIGKALKETMNSFKKNAKEKENVEWTDFGSCAISKLQVPCKKVYLKLEIYIIIQKFQTLSTQESTTLLRTKREDPVFLYHDRRYSVRTSNVFNFIGWYLIGGGSLWLGSSLLVLNVVSAWDPHCPVPAIHLSEMHLPEMQMPEFFHRRQNSPNIPQHTQFQPQHPPHTHFEPQQSNPNRANVEMGVVWGYPAPQEQIRYPIGQIPAQQYQHRPRRDVKETQKGWHLFNNKYGFNVRKLGYPGK
uniref:Uncharacterized protein n=1 Tax=Meloidogyne javanica TaxID=6303 RepID=A0A915M121_MELJA